MSYWQEEDMCTSVPCETCDLRSPGELRSILVAVHDNHAAVMPFVHALRLAYAANSNLEIVDVRLLEERISNIGVRCYLEKWGILPQNSKRSDVVSTGIHVSKVVKTGNKRQLIKKRLKLHRHDLLVIGTERKQNAFNIFSSSIAAYLADYFRHSTLFVPEECRPFIDAETGAVALRRVLMPVEDKKFYTPAFNKLRSIVMLFPELTVEVTLLHVGSSFPEIQIDEHPQLLWKKSLLSGPVVETICTSSETLRSDLVVMATSGRDTFSRKIVGSTTERVLGRILCPVLSVAISENES